MINWEALGLATLFTSALGAGYIMIYRYWQKAKDFLAIRKCNKGFTLIELMTVMTVLGIMATVATVRMVDTVDVARAATTKVTMNATMNALENYRNDLKEYPVSISDLLYTTGESKWRGPYLTIPVGGIILDGWEREFAYLRGDDLDAVNVTTYDLCSLGDDPDPLLGGADDLCNYII